MKLTELDPKWISHAGRDRVGVRFLCPHCRSTYLAVLFKNPVDGGFPVSDAYDGIGANFGNRWQRDGDTFDTLSISPSIDTSGTGHWHGYVTGGVAA